MINKLASTGRLPVTSLVAAAIILAASVAASAHPLGNFTTNHYARIEVGTERMAIRYVIDMAEIPAFQESQAIDVNKDGLLSGEELAAYATQSAAKYAAGILLLINGERVSLHPASVSATQPEGVGGLLTLRIECDFTASIAANNGARTVHFEDTNYRDRLGWREIVVSPGDAVAVFNSTAYGNAVTDELKAYPEDSLAAPLDERAADFAFVAGTAPQGAAALLTRDGRPAIQSRDRLAELIAVPELTLAVALIGLLIAAGLGALHALSPGHGKTVVGAYLVGSRGTPRHALFLGLTVTITHTIGVFALGVVTLFASQYVVPEKLYPVLSIVSGAIIVALGLSLFIRRLRAMIAASHHDHHLHSRSYHEHDGAIHSHSHGDHLHNHNHPHQDDHSHDHERDEPLVHSHGGRAHSHLPPGGDGARVTWRSLLALGILGGLLPCPSALVVLLSAISLNRIGYGLLLVVAFSIGLAATLTAVGLAFLYAGRLVTRTIASSLLVKVMPVASALVITCVGAVICYEAISSAGFDLAGMIGTLGVFENLTAQVSTLPTASALIIGLLFGMKHAVEADHIAAVSTIVSERKGWLSLSFVGGLWGVGHTLSLLIAGIAVLVLRVEISERVALALEFCVALMLIALGVNALRKILSGRIHLHKHSHGKLAHVHPHTHDESTQPGERHHHLIRIGARPLLVGMMHGLAGSAALMLVVLSTIPSRAVGLAYIAMFGLGSIGGMMLMSILVSLPVQLTANRSDHANQAVRMAAAIFSLGMGVYLACEIGFADGLFG